MQKKFKCNFNKQILGIILMSALLLCFASTQVVRAQNDTGGQTARDDAERIHITSDRLISDNKAKTAEFIGNVKATQGDTVIVSERLKVYYVDAAKDDKSQGDAASIKRIVATGNVNIEMGDRVAVSEQAVYNADTRVLVLTGENSKITEKENFVSGDKITLYRNEDRMVVEGSPKERVEAVLFTKDKGLN